MDAIQRTHIEHLIQHNRAHLRELELQQAKLGILAPSGIAVQLAEYQHAVIDLERQLAEALPLHNLPPRNYERFVGRQPQLEEVRRLLLPYPMSRHHLVTIDGIGGIGKSALALETAYQARDSYISLPDAERFDAIVWVSAKRSYLTADGILEQRQAFRALDDLYTAIAQVLDYPAITRAPAAEQRAIVERVLAEQRTLLILDNLETVDDEELLIFLRLLPDPTKAIVTTRHRIDVAYPVRLLGMPQADALMLIGQEATRKGVTLAQDEQEQLFGRTGGVPIAIVWSVGLMGLGGSVESVLRRLSNGHSDIAHFCFAESVAQIRGRDAHKLLLALALFEANVNRSMLGEVAGLNEDEFGRDIGLEELLHLSLVNKVGERFFLLPLTQSYALAEMAARPVLERKLREAWVEHLTDMAAPFNRPHWQQPDRGSLRRDGEHLATLARWAEQQKRPDLLLPIASALISYYDAIGRWRDMIDLNVRIIEYARLLNNHPALWSALNSFAWIIGQQGRYDEADQAFSEAYVLASTNRELAWQADILVNRAQLARRLRQFERASARCAEALSLLDSISAEQQPFVRADITIEQGKIARDLADWSSAQTFFQAAREVFQMDIDNPKFNLERAWGAYSQFAFVTHRLGNLDEAIGMYRKSLDAIREIGSRGFLATVLVRFAELETEKGDHASALEHAREALEWSHKLGMVQERAQAEALLARLAEPHSE